MWQDGVISLSYDLFAMASLSKATLLYVDCKKQMLETFYDINKHCLSALKT